MNPGIQKTWADRCIDLQILPMGLPTNLAAQEADQSTDAAGL